MDKILRINPYTLPEEQQGWRGLTVPGSHKRKWYTILHNDKVLVTALLLIPGETSVRHSHESGEVSVHFLSEIKPLVTWNPPGMLHGGAQARQEPTQPVAGTPFENEPFFESTNPEVAKLLKQMGQLQQQIAALQEGLRRLAAPEPSPRVIVDILFPPFKTTVDDPGCPEKKTVTGQWYD